MTFLHLDGVNRLDEFGEDTCDLLHTIEESFGIEFSADDLNSARTIRELADCISKKLKHSISEQCLSAVVFNRLRCAFIDLFGTPRSAIRPGTPLVNLLPWTVRRRRWRDIQHHLDFLLPTLRWPIWLLVLSAGAVIVSLASVWTSVTSRVGMLSGLALILGGILVWAMVFRLFAPLARAFPRSCNTFGDLVRLALGRNYAKIASQRGKSGDTEVLLVLRQLIAAETGITLEDVNSESYFPEDLNIY